MIPQPHTITSNDNGRIIPSFDVNGEVILPKLKSVYCNYRGRVTIYDVYGQKVHELSGVLTYEKHIEIEKRIDDKTEFDGIYDYRRTVKELKVAYGLKNATLIMTNTSDVQKDVVLFGANENSMMNNFGNSSSFEIQDDGFYQKMLNHLLINPFKLDSLMIECEEGCSVDRDIKHQAKNANGQILQYLIQTRNYISPTQLQANILQIHQSILINVGASLFVPVEPNEKVGLFCGEKSIKLKFTKA